MTSTALVIGASGFVGRALCDALERRGFAVRRASRRGAEGAIALDVADGASVAHAMQGCDAVFQLASAFGRGVESMDACAKTIVVGAANVLAAAARQGRPPSVVIVGSGEEYGACDAFPLREDAVAPPLSAYGACKLAATQLARHAARDVPVVVVRPSVVYGPGQRAEQLVASVVAAAVSDGVCTLRGGTQTRDFVYIDDVADALVHASACAHGGARGAVINVGSGVERRVIDVAERIVALARKGRIEVGPPSTRIGDVARQVYNIDRARELLGWQPLTSLEDGLRRTLAAGSPHPAA